MDVGVDEDDDDDGDDGRMIDEEGESIRIQSTVTVGTECGFSTKARKTCTSSSPVEVSPGPPAEYLHVEQSRAVGVQVHRASE